MIRLVLSLALLALSAIGAQAQSYPTRPVTVIVPFAAGGPADITGRIVAEFSRATSASSSWSRTSAAPAAPPARRAPHAPTPDGYTLDLRPPRHQRAGGVFYPNLAYDPEKDFEPIGLIAEQPELLTAQGFPGQQSQGVRRLRQGQRKQAQHGACRRRLGVLHRLPAAQQRHRHQADLVPFTGTAPAMNAILAGQVDYDCDPVLGPLPHVRAGTASALAIAAKSAARCCRTCRPPRSRACRSSTARRSTRCSRRRARRRRSSTGSPRRSQGARRAGRAQTAGELGAEIAEPSRRGPKALAAWCTARSRG